MDVGGLLSGVAARAAGRPRLTLALVGALALIGALAALSLRPTAATDTLVGRSSSTYRATQSFYSHFGEEPVEVLVKGDLRKLVLSSDIDRLVGLEGCLSGNLPSAALASEGGASGPCGRLRAAKAVKVVFGPGTFLNEAARQIDSTLANRSAQAERQATLAQTTVRRSALARGEGVQQADALGEQARKATMAGFAAEVSALAIRYGLSRPPTLDDHEFVSAVVFDSTKPSGTPKQRFAYLFPGRDAALVSVRLRSGLSEAQRSHAIALIRSAVAMKQWQLQNGETYLVTGEPVIVADVTGSISHSIELLLVAVLIVMAVVLALVFRGRPRLLPLAVALLASALTFGLLALSGAELTMASVAVLPVLVGLAVDYAIQFQSRVAEERESVAGSAGDRRESVAGSAGDRGEPVAGEQRGELSGAGFASKGGVGGIAVSSAIARAAHKGGPAIAVAVVASIGSLLVLLLSPVPMVRGFGLLLVLGLALAFACALTAGSAVMALVGGGDGAGGQGGGSGGSRGAGGSPAARGLLPASVRSAWREAGEILAENPLTRLVSRLALGTAVRSPGRVLAIGLALAALGWGLDTQTSVQTDIAKLAPQSLSSLRNLTALEHATGVGGEIDLMVSSRALTQPATIEWMSRYEAAVLARFGYSSTGGCAKARLCPAFSLPDLFHDESGSTAKLTRRQVNGLLAAVPSYFSQDVITADRRVATLAFGIRLMSLQQQQSVIEAMRQSLRPPKGVSAKLVGLSVLAAQAGSQVASPWRRVLTLLAALVAVAVILLICFRGDRRRALVPLAPVVLASGWSALVLFALRVPLNPMSVTLGALVIAISTEFGVLLSERQRQERADGYSSTEAMRRAYARTGAAVAASGATAIAGFGVLVLSDIAMLRDFGLVTLVDLSVSLLGVLVALPAAVAWADRQAPLRARLPEPGRAPAPIRP
ncbi:MAG TPA: MMPL family transporter [Solirubrobacteraceae bacterium]|nr:MMPL family transporter [Solirubrobacteraceae bacterium]